MTKKIQITEKEHEALMWSYQICSALYYARIAMNDKRIKELLEERFSGNAVTD